MELHMRISTRVYLAININVMTHTNKRLLTGECFADTAPFKPKLTF